MYLRNLTPIILPVLLAACFASSTLAQRGSTIEGRVVDQHNAPVYNIPVELYNDYYVMIGNARTSSQGRFTFRGLKQGRYNVRVKPFGTNLLEDSKEIVITTMSPSESDTEQVDFHLRVDKRFESQSPPITGTVFAQDVPKDAKILYKSGVDEIQTNPNKALADLEAAIKLFPDYFDALVALGKANVIQGKYADGYPYLLRALDVNKRCPDCFYSLSLSFYKLNQVAAAVKAIDAAVILDPQNAGVRLLEGMIRRLNNDLAGAEKSLLLSRSLFKVPNAEVHWQLSLTYNAQKRNHDAADELELYLKLATDIDAAEKEKVRQTIAKLRNAKS